MKTRQEFAVKKMVDKMISNNVAKNLGIDSESVVKGMAAWAYDLQDRGKIPSDWIISDGVLNILGNADLRGEMLKYPIGLVAGRFKYDGPKSEFEPTKVCNIENYVQYPPIGNKNY